MSGTIYRSTCLCLSSGPEPEGYSIKNGRSAEWTEWDAAWRIAVDAHHPRCCEEQQRLGRHGFPLLDCQQNRDVANCPHVAR